MPIEWCSVPAGEVEIKQEAGQGLAQIVQRYYSSANSITIPVPAFQISRTLVSNADYNTFIHAKDGYRKSHWWTFSDSAINARRDEPLESGTRGDDAPRSNITWFDALAYCRWLSDKLGQAVEMPLLQQWNRARIVDAGLVFPHEQFAEWCIWGDDSNKDYDADKQPTRSGFINTRSGIIMRGLLAESQPTAKANPHIGFRLVILAETARRSKASITGRLQRLLG